MTRVKSKKQFGIHRLLKLKLAHLPEDALEFEEPLSGFIAESYQITDRQQESLAIDHCELNHIKILGCDFGEFSLHEVLLLNSDFANTHMQRSYIDRCTIKTSRFMGASFGLARIRNSLFKDVRADMISLRFSRIENCRFLGCNLREANFQATEFKDVVFKKCDLSGAQFSQSKSDNVDLRSSYIDGIGIGKNDASGLIVDSSQCEVFARSLGVTVEDALLDDEV